MPVWVLVAVVCPQLGSARLGSVWLVPAPSAAMRLLPWLIVHLGAGSAAYVVSVDVRRAGRPLEHFWRSTGFW